eukprot:3937723-Pyramimonas_sp.AAC.1
MRIGATVSNAAGPRAAAAVAPPAPKSMAADQPATRARRAARTVRRAGNILPHSRQPRDAYAA